MAGTGQKWIQDEVHQNQILRELILKELRTQKLYTQYHVNPLRKGELAQGGSEAWESKQPLLLTAEPSLQLSGSLLRVQT